MNMRAWEELTTMKFISQFVEVASATPFALNEEGKISAGIAHGTGPQDAPNAINPVSAPL